MDDSDISLIHILRYAEERQIMIDVYHPFGFQNDFKGVAFDKTHESTNPQLGKYSFFVKLLHIFNNQKCLVKAYNHTIPRTTSHPDMKNIPDFGICNIMYRHGQEDEALIYSICTSCNNSILLNVLSMTQSTPSDKMLDVNVFKNHVTGYYQLCIQNRYLYPFDVTLSELNSQSMISSLYKHNVSLLLDHFPIGLKDEPFEWNIIPCENGSYYLQESIGNTRYITCIMLDTDLEDAGSDKIGYLAVTSDMSLATCFKLQFPTIYREGNVSTLVYPWNMYMYQNTIQTYFEQPLVIQLADSAVATVPYGTTLRATNAPVVMRNVNIFYYEGESKTEYDFTCAKSTLCRLPKQAYVISIVGFGEGITNNKQTSTFFCKHDMGLYPIVDTLQTHAPDEKLPWIEKYDIFYFDYQNVRFDPSMCTDPEFNMLEEPLNTNTLVEGFQDSAEAIDNMSFFKNLYLGRTQCDDMGKNDYFAILETFAETVYKNDVSIRNKIHGTMQYFYSPPFQSTLCSSVNIPSSSESEVRESVLAVVTSQVTFYANNMTGLFSTNKYFYHDKDSNTLRVSRLVMYKTEFTVYSLCNTYGKPSFVIKNDNDTYWYCPEALILNYLRDSLNHTAPLIGSVANAATRFEIEMFGVDSVAISCRVITRMGTFRFYVSMSRSSDRTLKLSKEIKEALPFFSSYFNFRNLHKAVWKSQNVKKKEPTSERFRLDTDGEILRYIRVSIYKELPSKERIYFSYDEQLNRFITVKCDFNTKPIHLYPLIPDTLGSGKSVPTQLLGKSIRIISTYTDNEEDVYLCNTSSIRRNLLNVPCNMYYLLTGNDSTSASYPQGFLYGKYLNHPSVLNEGIQVEYTIVADVASFDCKTGRYKYYIYSQDGNMNKHYLYHSINPVTSKKLYIVSENHKTADNCTFYIEKNVDELAVALDDASEKTQVPSFKIYFELYNADTNTYTPFYLSMVSVEDTEGFPSQLMMSSRIPVFKDTFVDVEASWRFHLKDVDIMQTQLQQSVSKNIQRTYLVCFRDMTTENARSRSRTMPNQLPIVIGNAETEFEVYEDDVAQMNNTELMNILEGFEEPVDPNNSYNYGMEIPETIDTPNTDDTTNGTRSTRQSYKPSKNNTIEKAFKQKVCASKSCDMDIKHTHEWLVFNKTKSERLQCRLNSKLNQVPQETKEFETRKWVSFLRDTSKPGHLWFPRWYVSWEVIRDSGSMLHLVANTRAAHKNDPRIDSFIVINLGNDAAKSKYIDGDGILLDEFDVFASFFVEQNGKYMIPMQDPMETKTLRIVYEDVREKLNEVQSSGALPNSSLQTIILLYANSQEKRNMNHTNGAFEIVSNQQSKDISPIDMSIVYATQMHIYIVENAVASSSYSYKNASFIESFNGTFDRKLYRSYLYGWIVTVISVVLCFAIIALFSGTMRMEYIVSIIYLLLFSFVLYGLDRNIRIRNFMIEKVGIDTIFKITLFYVVICVGLWVVIVSNNYGK
jgi:hypothetical protein